jgi:hypothetical protein
VRGRGEGISWVHFGFIATAVSSSADWVHMRVGTTRTIPPELREDHVCTSS